MIPAEKSPSEPAWIPAVAHTLEAVRLGLLPLCLGAVVLLQDPASATPLAPKGLWLAVALGFLPALTALRLWWDRPLRLPPVRVLVGLGALAGVVTAAYLASPLAPASRPAWQGWLLCLALSAAAVDLFAEERGRTWFLRSLVVAAGAAGARSLAQRFGLDPFPGPGPADFAGRVPGCFGNPNFAAGFFVLALPLLLHQAFAGKGLAWRRVAWIAAALSLAGLLLAAGKAGLVGLGAEAAVAGHLLWRSPAGAAARRAGLKALGMAALAAVLAAPLLLPPRVLGRLTGGPAAWAVSVSFREYVWRGSLAMARARPWLGWGPGTFAAAYPPFHPTASLAGLAHHAYEVVAPENWVLQILVETGILGLAACVAVLALILGPLRAYSRGWASDPGGAGLGLAVLASASGCLACNLASLDLFLASTLLPFLLLLGLAVALTARRAPALSLNPEPAARALVSLALCVTAAVPAVGALLALQAGRELAAAEALSRAGRGADALPHYRLAVQFDPDLREARYFLGCDLLDLGGADDLAEARQAFDGLRAYAPDYVQVHAQLGRLDAAQGRLDDAVAEYTRQLELDPWDRGAIEALASLEAAHGRLAQAAALLEGALARWPGDADFARNLALLRAALARGSGGAGKRAAAGEGR